MEWKPATIDEVKEIVKADLKRCNADQVAVFQQYSVEPLLAPIVRYGKEESVVVVARKSNEVIYWEDVEEGFNISVVGPEGRILEHWCNQDNLSVALNRLIQPRERRTGNWGPAINSFHEKAGMSQVCFSVFSLFLPERMFLFFSFSL